MYPGAIRSSLVRAKLEYEGDMIRDESKGAEWRKKPLSWFGLAAGRLGGCDGRFDAFSRWFCAVCVEDHGAVNEKVKPRNRGRRNFCSRAFGRRDRDLQSSIQ